MAHKKGQGSSRNGRDSQSKRLGVKACSGERVNAGAILVRQRGTKWQAGRNVKCGRDYTLFATCGGTVVFTKKNRTVQVNPPSFPDDDQTSYHEAGHAVVLWKAGIRLVKVTIVPDPVTGNKGHVLPDFSKMPNPLPKPLFETLVVAYLAGSAAVWILEKYKTGNDPPFLIWGGDKDFIEANVRRFFQNDADYQKYLTMLSERAVLVVAQRDNWSAVSSLAEELKRCRELPGNRVGAIIGRYTGRFPPPP